VYDYRVILGIFAAILGVVSLAPYIRDMFRGITKPHPMTWFVWALINIVAFFAQVAGGGGPGAWVSGVVAFECFVIALFSLSRGEKRMVALDWWCFAGALTGLILWQVTDDPLAAIILVTLTDALASVPTFRKSYLRPYEETLSSYFLGTLRSLFALPALGVFSLTTVLYLAFTALSDTLLVVTLLLRRRQLGRVSKI